MAPKYSILGVDWREYPRSRCRSVTEAQLDLSNIEEEDDPQLVARAQRGDRRAFGVLVQRHQVAVYRVCVRILIDVDDAADAAQESFLRAYTRLDSFRQQSAFKTWLVRVAVNVSLNARDRRQPVEELDELRLPPTPSAEAAAMRADTVASVHRALQILPHNHRVAVILRDLEGYSYGEVANILDVPEGTAKGWAHRGRERLKEILT